MTTAISIVSLALVAGVVVLLVRKVQSIRSEVKSIINKEGVI